MFVWHHCLGMVCSEVELRKEQKYDIAERSKEWYKIIHFLLGKRANLKGTSDRSIPQIAL